MVRLGLVDPRDFFGNGVAVKLVEALLIRDAVPNTILFSGPGAVGKALLAYFFAKALVCENGADKNHKKPLLSFCGECYACRSIETANQPEFVWIKPRTTELTLAQLREDYDSLREAYLHPNRLKYRIYVLEECHTISEELANSMLKILEEPPLRTVFILITDRPHLLLPTILSRSFKVGFCQESLQELEDYLLKSQGRRVGRQSESIFRLAAYFSQGRVGLAKTLLISDKFLPKLAGFLHKLRGAFLRDARTGYAEGIANNTSSTTGKTESLKKTPSESFLYTLGDEVLELAEDFSEILLRVETGENLPQDFYVPPCKLRCANSGNEVTTSRKNELARSALRFLFDSIKLTLFDIDAKTGFHLVSKCYKAFSDAHSMLDVNLREKQVVDYLLTSLA